MMQGVKEDWWLVKKQELAWRPIGVQCQIITPKPYNPNFPYEPYEPEEPTLAWRPIGNRTCQTAPINPYNPNLPYPPYNPQPDFGWIPDNSYCVTVEPEPYNPTPLYPPYNPDEFGWEGYQPYCIKEGAIGDIDCDKNIDIAFVLDTTGSMDTTINNLTNSLSNIVQSIENNYPESYRIGLIAVTDGTPKYVIENVFELNNESSVQNSLNNISRDVGGDEPEPTDLAVEAIFNGELGEFREGATKVIFIITDAPPSGDDDSYDSSDMTFSKSLADEAALRNIQVFPIAVDRATLQGTAYYEDIQEINNYYASVTNGVAYNIENGIINSNIEQSIIEADCPPPTTESVNTGYKGYEMLRERNLTTGELTGNTKPNIEGDPDYVAPVLDETFCPSEDEPNPEPDPVITPETKIVILFDGSGSMNDTLPKLEEMRDEDQYLRAAIGGYYDTPEGNKYDEMVTIEKFEDPPYVYPERTFYKIVKGDIDNTIYLIFQNEAHSIYHLATFPENGSHPLKPDYAEDIQALIPKVQAAENFNAVIFQIESGFPDFVNFLKAIENGNGNYAGNNGISELDAITVEYGLPDGDDPQNYTDRIVSALTRLGFNI